MFRFNMFLQIPWVSCSVFTLIAWLSYSFMLIFNMSLQITGLSGCEFTLVTWISLSFMFVLFLIWFFKFLGSVAAYSHWSHGYLTPSYLFSICLFRSPAWVAANSQWEQGYLTPSCLLLICVFKLLDLVNHIFHRDKFSLFYLSAYYF